MSSLFFYRFIQLLLPLLLLGGNILAAPNSVPSSQATTASLVDNMLKPDNWGGLEILSATADPATLNYAWASGGRWTRTKVYWDQVQSSQAAAYDWSVYDNAFLAYKNANILNLAVFQNPGWLSSTNYVTPQQKQTVLNFVSALVDRYNGDGINDAPGSPKIDALEVYNEPDDVHQWGNHGAEYADMLHDVYTLVKSKAPNMLVMFGGVAYANFVQDNPAFPFNKNFLPDAFAELKARGWQNNFDAMNWHYYPSSGITIQQKVTIIKNLMAQYGLTQVQICSETGVSSDQTADASGGEPQQSIWLAKTYTQARSMALDPNYNLRMVAWYTLLNQNYAKPWTNFNDYGLISVNASTGALTPKNSFRAYQTAMNQLKGTTGYTLMTPAQLGGSVTLTSYRFSKGANREVRVVWSSGLENFTLPAAPRGMHWEVIDIYGNAVGPVSGLTFVAGNIPVYANLKYNNSVYLPSADAGLAGGW